MPDSTEIKRSESVSQLFERICNVNASLQVSVKCDRCRSWAIFLSSFVELKCLKTENSRTSKRKRKKTNNRNIPCFASEPVVNSIRFIPSTCSLDIVMFSFHVFFFFLNLCLWSKLSVFWNEPERCPWQYKIWTQLSTRCLTMEFLNVPHSKIMMKTVLQSVKKRNPSPASYPTPPLPK